LNVVAFSFQVSTHTLELKGMLRKQAINILCQDEARPAFSNNPKHRRPEMAGVCVPKPFPCRAEWLAGKSTAEHVDTSAKRGSIESEDIRK